MKRLVTRAWVSSLSIVSMSLMFFAPAAQAAPVTLLSDSFGTGSTDSTFNEAPDVSISGDTWTEDNDGAEKRAAASGNDTASPNGDRFATVFGDSGELCITVDATGYNNLLLSYYWRGDSDAESNDEAYVEVKSASGNDCDDNSGWTELQEHELDSDSSWTTQSPFSVPTSFNNSSFLLRLRTDANSSNEHFRIDGVLLTGEVLSGPQCNGQNATIYVDTGTIVGGPQNGLPYNGILLGTDGDDVIMGTSGNDYVDGLDGEDLICGDDGDDTLNGSEGDDEIYGDDGDDRLSGGDGDDTLDAGDDDDIAFGGSDGDDVDGGDDIDFCDGGPGSDSISNCAPGGDDAGAIIIEKVVAVGNVAQDFDFEVTAGSSLSFSLDDDDTDATLPERYQFAAFSATSGGTEYVVTETALADWTVTDISCTGGDVVVDLPNRSVSIDLDDGEEITCTFTNEGPEAEEDGNGGIQGTRRRNLNLVRFLSGQANVYFGETGLPSSAFGGPGPGGGTGELSPEQHATLCSIRQQIQLLAALDITDLIAENYAHIYDVAEETIADILHNGTGCEEIDAAKAEEARLQAEAEARGEADRLAAIDAAIKAERAFYQGKPVEFAVGEDGYPVSSDALWNVCIRGYELFVAGEDKPVNCRKYHEGHTWEHPDTKVSFTWHDRFVKKVEVHGKQVALNTVPTPDYIVHKNMQLADLGDTYTFAGTSFTTRGTNFLASIPKSIIHFLGLAD